MRVTVQFFHPFPRRSVVNRTLREAISGCENIRLRDLYELYPDFSIDVDVEQRILLDSDVVVFQHPFYWYNCPSLMKEWLDAVLERGWAYGPGGTRLHGKYWLQVVTTGGPQEAYSAEGHNEFPILELMRPFEKTARLCGMTPLHPVLIHGTHQMTESERTDHARRYRSLLENLKQGNLPESYSTR